MLNKSIEFFSKLGLTFKHQFTDENARWMIVSEDIFVFLLVQRSSALHFEMASPIASPLLVLLSKFKSPSLGCGNNPRIKIHLFSR
jgi:hypothetical protein